MAGRRTKKIKKKVEVAVEEKIIEKIIIKRICNEGEASEQNVIAKAPTHTQTQAAADDDEGAGLECSYIYENVTAENLEGAADFYVEVEEGVIVNDQSGDVGETRIENLEGAAADFYVEVEGVIVNDQSGDVGDTTIINKDQVNSGNDGGQQLEVPTKILKTSSSNLKADKEEESDSEESENEEDQNGVNKKDEKKNVVIVVDKIKTKAMDYAIKEKLNVFAILMTLSQEQFLIKVSELDNQNDVLIRGGKIHFRTKPGISTEKIEKEDGLYKRCRYQIVAKFQELRDVENGINLVVLPVMKSDKINMNFDPSFISRKMFFDKAKLYKNCTFLPYTIAKKQMSQFGKKRQIKIEPIDEDGHSKENQQVDPITGEIIDRKELVIKPKRPYKRRDPAAYNARKLKPKKGVQVKIEMPESEEAKEILDEVPVVGVEVEVETEVEKTTTSDKGKESKEASVKPAPKSKSAKRRARKSGPGRPSKKSKQAQTDEEKETEAETTGLIAVQKAMEKIALDLEIQTAGSSTKVQREDPEVPELGRRKRIIKKKKVFE